jgi:hypothetical protein
VTQVNTKSPPSLDDWTDWHHAQSQLEGWTLVPSEGASLTHSVEIQDPNGEDDWAAAQKFRASFDHHTDHATLAYQILKSHSPQELLSWGLHQNA